ncbi:MAG TPA: DNA polymerase IV [Acidimicrobiia bacterium]|jgi:DNA polymerase-4|nr:DNA polymerase IV [Acidimicrobiia bacterium]
MTQAAILHVDLDAFYASVEQMKHPHLRGKPVAVGGGVILAASYEARQFGVRAAMPLRLARELCPWLIVVKGSFSDYSELSEQVFDDICQRFTPQVEQVSIDEAFLDVSGSIHLFGTPGEIGAAVRRAVRGEAGLAISVGVARTKFLAKVGSRYAKPDGMKVIDSDDEIAFLHSLPVDYIWGVGPVTERKLHAIGIATVGELAHADRRVIEQRLGRGGGAHLMALAWNRDPRMVSRHRRAKSVGAQSSFGGGGRDAAVRREILSDLADRVGSRLRKKARAARTITVRVRFGDLSSVTRSATLRAPVAATPALLAVATHLADDGVLEAGDRDVNLLGIQTSKLVVSPHVQLELPFEESLGAHDVAYAGSVAELERHELDDAMDALHERFGKDAVGRASRLLGRRGGVPDEFRELATRD